MNTAPIPFLPSPNYPQTRAWIEALQRAMPQERICLLGDLDEASKQQCSVAIVANPDPDELQALPNLRWIHSVWAGVERLVENFGCTDLKIVRLIDPQLARTMAEAVLAWTLYLHRDMPTYAQQQAQQRWHALNYMRPEQRTVGILGLGALGKAAAQSLLAAHFKVCGWSASPKNIAGVESFTGTQGLNSLLVRTDILVCLLPLTAQTKGLLRAEHFAQLPKGAAFINFARGAIVNDVDLHAALDNGKLKHAVLDVFETEPLPATAWHWQHPNVTVLPHCSAPTDKDTAAAIVAANIQQYRSADRIPEHVKVARGY